MLRARCVLIIGEFIIFTRRANLVVKHYVHAALAGI